MALRFSARLPWANALERLNGNAEITLTEARQAIERHRVIVAMAAPVVELRRDTAPTVTLRRRSTDR